MNNEQTNKPPRPRGTGRLYQYTRKVNGESVVVNQRWWLQYYRDGKRICEPTGTTNKRLAEKMIQKRLAQISTNTFVEPKTERTLVRELFERLRLDYQNNDRKSWDDAEARWRLHLEPIFGSFRATNVTHNDLNAYVNDRKQHNASNATINRELAVLKRMFVLGEVVNAPKFPHLEERNVRKGFVEDTQYSKLANACAKHGLWLRAMFEAGYTFGWRVSELLNLRVRNVDVAERMLHLDPGTTKNDEAREAFMPETLFLLIQQCIVGKKRDDYVFTREDGKPVRDFRGAWKTARAEAGVPNLIFHDLRRTAVRNMVKDRTPEKVAMSISGHKTRSIFDRYHIVDATDKKLAAQRMEERQKAQLPTALEQHSNSIASFAQLTKPTTEPN
jgi:integrase